MKDKKKLLNQIFKFIIVGGIATIIDWIIFYVLNSIFNINPLISNIFSFTISLIYNYIASVKWVFVVSKKKNKKRIFIEFVFLSIIGLLLSEFIIWILVDKLLINSLISKIISTAIVMVFNFITRKIFLED